MSRIPNLRAQADRRNFSPICRDTADSSLQSRSLSVTRQTSAHAGMAAAFRVYHAKRECRENLFQDFPAFPFSFLFNRKHGARLPDLICRCCGGNTVYLQPVHFLRVLPMLPDSNFDLLCRTLRLFPDFRFLPG